MIGERIYELRKSKGLSQEDLASELGVSRQTISNWESEQTSPDLKQSTKLAQLFGISIDELSGNEKIISLRVETKKAPLSFWKGAAIAIAGLFSLSLLFILISALTLLNNVNDSIKPASKISDNSDTIDFSFVSEPTTQRLVCELGSEVAYLHMSEDAKMGWSDNTPQEVVDVLNAIDVDENEKIDVFGPMEEIETIFADKGYSCKKATE